MRGRCMCGAVGFEADPAKSESHACHCEMCRRWTGSAMLAVEVGPEAIRFDEEAPIRTVQSSDWAERAWCDRCGATLYYRLTAEGPMQGTYHLAVGLFEAPERFPLAGEIFIDRKPASYAFAGHHPKMTAAEFEAMIAAAASPDAPG